MGSDHNKGLSWGISAGIFVVGTAFFYGMPAGLKEHVFRQNPASLKKSVAEFHIESTHSCGFSSSESIGRFPSSTSASLGCGPAVVDLLAKGEFAHSVDRLQRTLNLIQLPENIKKKLHDLFSKPKHVEAFEVTIKMDNGNTQSFPAFRVQHNCMLGPCKGGIRFGMDVNASEVSALSMGMTYKAPLTGLPLGGAKGGVQVDVNKLSQDEVARLARGYFEHLSRKGLVGPDIDVPAPDMNTNPKIMELMLDQHLRVQGEIGAIKDPILSQRFKEIAQGNFDDPKKTPFVDAYIQWAVQENKVAPLLGTITGKAVGRGGSLGRNEATGLGVYQIAREYVKHVRGVKNPDKPMEGVKVALQGFGNVGSHAAKYCHEHGGAAVTTLVEWANRSGKFNDTPMLLFEATDPRKGLPITEMYEYQVKNGTLEGFEHTDARTTRKSSEDALKNFLQADVDLLIPAALGDQIKEDNWHLVKKGTAIIEAANNPTSPEAEALLTQAGVTVVPDSLANAGGVTVSYFELLQNTTKPMNQYWSREKVFEELDQRMTSAFEQVLEVLEQNPGYSWRNAGQHVSLQPFVRD